MRPRASRADVAAKAAFLLGDDGPAWLEQQALQGRFVSPTEVVLAGDWPDSSEPISCRMTAATTTWYAARAGGVIAYLLVSACVLAGILLAGKRRVPGLPRFAVEDVHRFLGILAGVFVAVHVGAIALDTVVPFSLTQLVVPFTSDVSPARNRARRRRARASPRGFGRRTGSAPAFPTASGVARTTQRSPSGYSRRRTASSAAPTATRRWLLGLYAVTVVAVACAAALRFGRGLRTAAELGLALATAGGALAAVARARGSPATGVDLRDLEAAADRR